MPADDRRQRAIGVFDSGIGGLTVVREMIRALPAEPIVYFGDTARVPYGTKSPETVQRFTREAARFLMRQDIKYLVIACNTASALALDALQSEFELPMSGVILPGARAAARVTKTKSIGVIGTSATVRSDAYRRALADLDAKAQVSSVACPLFVPLAEEGWTDGAVVDQIAAIYLEPFQAAKVDTLILGCTHYPLLRASIATAAGPSVTLVDTAEETVRDVTARLDQLGLRAASSGPGARQFYVSDVPAQFERIGSRFLGQPIGPVSWVDQNDLPWYAR